MKHTLVALLLAVTCSLSSAEPAMPPAVRCVLDTTYPLKTVYLRYVSRMHPELIEFLIRTEEGEVGGAGRWVLLSALHRLELSHGFGRHMTEAEFLAEGAKLCDEKPEPMAVPKRSPWTNRHKNI